MRTPGIVLLVLSLTTLGLAVVLLRMQGRGGETTLPDGSKRPATLLLYCAAGLKGPVTAVAKQYEQEYGTRIDIQFGGSGTLLSSLRLAASTPGPGAGDLYLPADSSYIDLARKDNLVDEVIPLAKMSPVIAVATGNPKSIHGLTDLLRSDVRVAIANSDAASIGKQTKLLLTRTGQWDALEAAVRRRGVFKPTVNDIANDVRLGTVDASIVWDATVRQKDYREKIEAIPIPSGTNVTVEVPISVLHGSAHPAAALHFARYLASRDKGLPVFARMGFDPVDGAAEFRWGDRGNRQ